jgi:hypothetical protein
MREAAAPPPASCAADARMREAAAPPPASCAADARMREAAAPRAAARGADACSVSDVVSRRVAFIVSVERS